MSMPIKLLLDEHIWEGLTGALTQQGYDVVHINNTDNELKNTVRWLQEFRTDS